MNEIAEPYDALKHDQRVKDVPRITLDSPMPSSPILAQLRAFKWAPFYTNQKPLNN